MEEEKLEQEIQEEENVKKEDKKAKKDRKREEEISALKEEIHHWKNAYYKSYADTENLRKSLEKDYRDALKYRSASFIEDLIPILDAFDSALSIPVEDEKLKNYLVGFTYIHNQLLSILDKEGIKVLDAKAGDKFDEKSMHAIEVGEEESDVVTVLKVNAKGYKLHDHLLRPILVKVTKSKSNDKEEEKKLDA